MASRPLTVEWLDDPEDWLLPVVAALDDASLCCRPPEQSSGSGHPARKYVLRVAVEAHDPHASGERSDALGLCRKNSLGKSYDWINGYTFHLLANESVLRFSTRPLLHTGLGKWLHIKRWTWRVVLSLLVPILALIGLQPGARIVNVLDPGVDPDEAVMLSLQVPSLLTNCVAAALLIVMTIIALQRTSRDLFFRAAYSFECFAITCSLVISRAAWAYEHVALLIAAGECTWTDLASFVIFVLLVSIPGGFAYSTFDAFFMSQRLRALALTLIFVHSLGSYFRFARLAEWSTIKLCYWSYCTTPKSVCVSMYGNAAVFVAKLWLAYARGDRFAILRTSYRRPGPPTQHRPRCWSSSCCYCCRRRQQHTEGNDGGVPHNPSVHWPRAPQEARRINRTTSFDSVSTYYRAHAGIDSLVVCVQDSDKNRSVARSTSGETGVCPLDAAQRFTVDFRPGPGGRLQL